MQVKAPKMVLLLGLDNGPSESLACMLEEVCIIHNCLTMLQSPPLSRPACGTYPRLQSLHMVCWSHTQVAWIADNYLTFSADNFVLVDGKPLLVLFDGTSRHTPRHPPCTILPCLSSIADVL